MYNLPIVPIIKVLTPSERRTDKYYQVYEDISLITLLTTTFLYIYIYTMPACLFLLLFNTISLAPRKTSTTKRSNLINEVIKQSIAKFNYNLQIIAKTI